MNRMNRMNRMNKMYKINKMNKMNKINKCLKLLQVSTNPSSFHKSLKVKSEKQEIIVLPRTVITTNLKSKQKCLFSQDLSIFSARQSL